MPIIQVFEREGEKIHGMGRGTSKDTSSLRCGDLLAFEHVTFYAYDEHHRSLSVCDRNGREQGRAQGEEVL